METILTILGPFFDDPNGRYSIRQLSRMLKVNHTTVRQHLNKCVKEGYLTSKREGVYTFYRLEISRKTLNLKLYHNLEKLRTSRIIDDLKKAYDYPVIVVFGSYAKAMDDMMSDIDVCVITNVKKEMDVQKYKKELGRPLSLHIFDKKRWGQSKKNNPALVNNICNGIVLSGELEVI